MDDRIMLVLVRPNKMLVTGATTSAQILAMMWFSLMHFQRQIQT
jgi:hypothetical protein